LLVERGAGENELVDLGDAEAAQPERTERRSKVAADDALVVLPASLPRRSLVEPVLAQMIERLVGRLCGAQATSDLLDLVLVLAQPEGGVGVLVVDLRAAMAVRIHPADAPLPELLDWAGHGSVLPPARRVLSCNSSGRSCRTRWVA